jgi:hypothetical protein
MASPYVIKDFEWVRGTTKPDLIFTFTRYGSPLAFDDARLSVYKDQGKTLAFRATVTGGQIVMDAELGKITFTPTAAQTRSLTQTKADGLPRNKYEVELRINGSEEVYVMGNITATGGLNDDEDIS